MWGVYAAGMLAKCVITFFFFVAESNLRMHYAANLFSGKHLRIVFKPSGNDAGLLRFRLLDWLLIHSMKQ